MTGSYVLKKQVGDSTGRGKCWVLTQVRKRRAGLARLGGSPRLARRVDRSWSFLTIWLVSFVLFLLPMEANKPWKAE
jgi:hypothetical protein